MSDREINIPLENVDPAPIDWRDAYREAVETSWRRAFTAPRLPHQLLALAAEIRQGLAFGLLAPVPTDPDACLKCRHHIDFHTARVGCTVQRCDCLEGITAPAPTDGFRGPTGVGAWCWCAAVRDLPHTPYITTCRGTAIRYATPPTAEGYGAGPTIDPGSGRYGPQA